MHGFMYEHGRGVHRDCAEAVLWCRLAAKQPCSAIKPVELATSGSRARRKGVWFALKFHLRAISGQLGHANGQTHLSVCLPAGLPGLQKFVSPWGRPTQTMFWNCSDGEIFRNDRKN